MALGSILLEWYLSTELGAVPIQKYVWASELNVVTKMAGHSLRDTTV